MTSSAFPRRLSNIKAVLVALASAVVTLGTHGGTEGAPAAPPQVFEWKLSVPPPAFESALAAPASVLEVDWSIGELRRILSADRRIGSTKIIYIQIVSEKELVVTTGRSEPLSGAGHIVTLSFEEGRWQITKTAAFVK